jgi:hypothetical protein
MAEKLFYYLLALTLAGSFLLVYNMILTELRNRRERLEQERVRAVQSETKRLQASKSTEQQESVEVPGCNHLEALNEISLDLIKQLQTELNRRVMDLEREL